MKKLSLMLFALLSTQMLLAGEWQNIQKKEESKEQAEKALRSLAEFKKTLANWTNYESYELFKVENWKNQQLNIMSQISEHNPDFKPKPFRTEWVGRKRSLFLNANPEEQAQQIGFMIPSGQYLDYEGDSQCTEDQMMQAFLFHKKPNGEPEYLSCISTDNGNRNIWALSISPTSKIAVLWNDTYEPYNDYVTLADMDEIRNNEFDLGKNKITLGNIPTVVLKNVKYKYYTIRQGCLFSPDGKTLAVCFVDGDPAGFKPSAWIEFLKTCYHAAQFIDVKTGKGLNLEEEEEF